MLKLFFPSVFFTSFMPLWLCVIAIDIRSIIQNNMNLWTEWLGIFSIGLGAILSIVIIRKTLKNLNLEENASRQYVLCAQEDKNATTYFLLSNVLPLLAFDFTNWFSTMLFLIIYLSLAFLCVVHNRIDGNICLEIAGYRLFKCSLKGNDLSIQKDIIILVKRSKLNRNDALDVKMIDRDFWFAIYEKK